MQATTENLEMIRGELVFDIMFIKEKHADRLNESQMEALENELDKKIMKMLPSYSGNLPPGQVFIPVLKRTAESFVNRQALIA